MSKPVKLYSSHGRRLLIWSLLNLELWIHQFAID